MESKQSVEVGNSRYGLLFITLTSLLLRNHGGSPNPLNIPHGVEREDLKWAATLE